MKFQYITKSLRPLCTPPSSSCIGPIRPYWGISSPTGGPSVSTSGPLSPTQDPSAPSGHKSIYKITSKTIHSPELPVIKLTKLIRFRLKTVTFVICSFTSMLFVCLLIFHYQYLVYPQGLSSKYPFMVVVLLSLRKLIFSKLFYL